MKQIMRKYFKALFVTTSSLAILSTIGVAIICCANGILKNNCTDD